ncbi:hypothetical protein [Streptomyces sp. NPDC001137]|uniref:hypothetical protein n=1 Tax=Streptomyces sp. NPDC001137 TaxID=3154378 RepID=UPI00332B4ECC
MSLLEFPDVFIGSTDDGHTFVVLNRRIRDADLLLTEAGFLSREHLGRRLYLLPPGTAQEAHERAGIAMYGLLAHTRPHRPFLDDTLEPRPSGSRPRPSLPVR